MPLVEILFLSRKMLLESNFLIKSLTIVRMASSDPIRKTKGAYLNTSTLHAKIHPCHKRTELHIFWWKAYSVTYQGLCWRWCLWWLMLEAHAPLVTLRTFCLPVAVYLLTIPSFLFLAPVIGGHRWNCQPAISHRKAAICTLQTDKQMSCH